MTLIKTELYKIEFSQDEESIIAEVLIVSRGIGSVTIAAERWLNNALCYGGELEAKEGISILSIRRTGFVVIDEDQP